MKVILLSTTDFSGGAAIACKRLFIALKKTNEIEVKMVVRSAASKEKEMYALNKTCWERGKNFFYFAWERFVIWSYNCFSRKNLFAVSIANTGTDISTLPEVQQADIIHLHWINQGFLSLKDIKKLLALGKPVIWTLHDMWPCTSICHYAWKCEHYQNKCGNCFYLRYPSSGDLSAQVWRKKNFLNDSGMKLVTVSSWLQQKVKSSALTNRLETIVIPNVLDLNLFYPRDKKEARKRLEIDTEKKVIVFGAAKIDNPLKGFELLKKALLNLCKQKEMKNDFVLFLFGKVGGDQEDVFQGLPCDYRYIGEVHSGEILADLYSAADVTVVPSHYETFGQVIIESMACGTPVVAFDSSGQTDIISHQEDGYLATYDSVEDFGRGIRWVLFETKGQEIRHKAIKKVKLCYAEEVIVKKYLELYKKIFHKA